MNKFTTSIASVFIKITISSLCIFSLSSCKDPDDIVITDPKQSYEESLALIQDNELKKAVKNFDAIERDFPSSEFAMKSLMMRAYTLYLQGEFLDAIFATEDFIKQYPANKHLDYIYYLKAICNYDQIVDLGRDQKQTEDTIEAMDELIMKFPRSKYSKDAVKKRLYSYNAIAGKEMNIGITYLRKGYIIAALTKFHNVVRYYSDTIFAPEALYRLTEIYYRMGINNSALLYASVLGYNYPDSPWYHASYSLLTQK